MVVLSYTRYRRLFKAIRNRHGRGDYWGCKDVKNLKGILIIVLPVKVQFVYYYQIFISESTEKCQYILVILKNKIK